MGLNFYTASRRTPDLLMEELVAVLLRSRSLDFKALFLQIHVTLKEKNINSGGEEMLRLRTYDKLQSLVRDGIVTKIAGKYKGGKKQLLLFSTKLREKHNPAERKPGMFPPRRRQGSLPDFPNEGPEKEEAP